MILIKVLVILPLIGNLANASRSLDYKFIRSFTKIFDTFVAPLIGQKPSNENGTRLAYADYLLEDASNDNLGRATPQQMILRAGFRYKNHYVESDDGYITQLIRIINPLADYRKLKRPPVMMIHGGIIDPTCWIWASAIQHHPEKYPRTIHDGPITSWNRSLAFTLANNGFDVWLVGSRGANNQNQFHADLKTRTNKTSEMLEVERERIEFWQFSLDEIIEHELPRQIDKVLDVTGALKVNLIGISLGAQTSLSLLASNKAYAKKVHSCVALGPTIDVEGSNHIIKLVVRYFSVVHVDNKSGALFATELTTSQVVRDFILLIGERKRLRYTLLWALESIVNGPTPVFQTGLEPAVYGHILMPTSSKVQQHFCQQMAAGQLQKYDYGSVKNFVQYGTIKPPAYDLSEVHNKNLLIVAGSNDNVGTPASVQKILKQVKHKPALLNVVGYNHIDLVAAMDNDRRVNLPILRYLDRLEQAQ